MAEAHPPEANPNSENHGDGNGNTNTGTGANSSTNSGQFECNICLDEAKDAVISLCGHLFCWPCLLQWLETRPHRQECPVCKAGIDRDKVIPLYGRGSTSKEDPRNKTPKRPQAQRPAPENRGNNGVHFGEGGFQMSFGIGAFPFGFFGTLFNLNDGRPPAPRPGSPQYHEDVVLSRVFLGIAFFMMIWMFYT